MNNWTADASGAIRALNKMSTHFKSGYFGRSLKAAQVNVVEKNVKERLQTNSTRDPSATPPGLGYNTAIIAGNIRTGEPEFNDNSWFVGTGNISELDANDPLPGLSSIVSGQKMALWRILEKGALPHFIQASNAPMLQFYWYRYGIWFVGPEVSHPGQKGRHFFLTIDDAIYDSDKKVKDLIGIAIKNIVKTYSYN